MYRKSIFHLVSSCSPSTQINAWRVKIQGTFYLVTPAHVALHVKDGKYSISKFLEGLSSLNWKVPHGYLINNDVSLSYDCAWCEVPSPDTQSVMEVLDESLAEAIPCEIYFRQPYDLEAKFDAKDSVLGSMESCLYPSRTRGLMEAVDVGYRGLSGALAIDRRSPKPQAVGMLLRRGLPIKLNHVEKVAPNVSTANRSRNLAGRLNKKIADSENQEMADSSDQLDLSDEPVLRALLAKIDNLSDKVDTRIDNLSDDLSAKMDTISARVGELENRVLTVEDLDSLLNVTAMRRSAVMPFSRIASLVKEGVEINSLAGSAVHSHGGNEE